MAIKSSILKQVEHTNNPREIGDKTTIANKPSPLSANEQREFNEWMGILTNQYDDWKANRGGPQNHKETPGERANNLEAYIKAQLGPDYQKWDKHISQYVIDSKDSGKSNAQNKGQTYVPEAWKQKTDIKVETVVPENGNTSETGKTDGGNTSTDTSTNVSTSGKQEDVTNSKTATDAALDLVAQLFGGYNNNMGDFQTNYADKAWEMIESYYNENPLETDYGKAILDYYGVLGENSANAVNAATAGENAGNIDSFAAANAERQRLSRYGQAVQNIYGMSSERAKNVNDLLSNLGVNMNELYKTRGQYGVGTAADYAANLYNTDASSTAAYNELMAALEGNKTYTYDLSDDGVTALLKKAYNDLNPIGSDSTEIDWTATDSDQWKDVIQNVLKAYPNSGLTEGYLRDMIEKIIKGTQAETGTTGEANTNTVDVSKLPAWLQSIVLETTK